MLPAHHSLILTRYRWYIYI